MAVPAASPIGSVATKGTAAAGFGPISGDVEFRYTIPRKTNERRTGPFDRALYRQRNLVERTINRLKQFRRIATRYEKKAENYLAMLQIGALLLWL